MQTGTPQIDDSIDWNGEIWNADGSPAIITGLVHSNDYPIRVRAKNAEGDGPWVVINITDTNYLPFEIGSEHRFIPAGSGLGVGDSFRLLFVSSNTIQATEKRIV